MTDPKETNKPKVQTREPKKKTQGIFDNLRKIEPHPVEEILGLAPPAEATPEERTPRTPPTLPTGRTPHTSRTAGTPRTAPIAPERDYMKVANSITREMVAGGYFTGKSKQLYDFLYSKTRGAIVPARNVRITKPRLMQGSAIGSERTLLKNIAHLKAIGLIQVNVTDGEHGGNEYIVFLPEEVNLTEQPTPPTPPTPPNAPQRRHAPAEVGGVPPVESGVRDVGYESTESTLSNASKTSSKDLRTIDDDAALAGLLAILKQGAKDVTGKLPSSSESERWLELGEVLITELKIASARTTVSSAPAFLAEHLRRRLFKKDQKQIAEEVASLSSSQANALLPTEDQIKACPDCGGSGLYYPEGYEKGVAKCKHEKLSREGN